MVLPPLFSGLKSCISGLNLKMPKVEIKVSKTHPALHGTPLGRVPPRLLSPLCSLYIEILYLFKKYFSWKTFNVFCCLTYVSRKAITVFPLVNDSLRSAPSSHLFEFPFWTKKASVNWRQSFPFVRIPILSRAYMYCTRVHPPPKTHPQKSIIFRKHDIQSGLRH